MSRPAITPCDVGAVEGIATIEFGGGFVPRQMGYAEGGLVGPTVEDCAERLVLPSQHPANLANRERSMRAVNLATVIANDVVYDVVAENAVSFQMEGHYWFDTKRPTLAEPDQGDFWRREDIEECEQRIARALQYIELRDPDAFPFRFIRHPDQPHLVRFEAKP